MIALRQTGDDLAKYVRDTAKLADAAEDGAARIQANRAARELRQQIQAKFGSSWRVWAAPGFAKAIKVKRLGLGWYRVYSNAQYTKNRTETVDLLWVFDQAPTVISGFGKSGVAIPIPGQTPIFGNGRRYAWPSELVREGWMLEFAPIMGKASSLILGRQNTHEPWRPLYIWKKSVKMPKRLDLETLFNKYAAPIDQTWADILDGKIQARAFRLAA